MTSASRESLIIGRLEDGARVTLHPKYEDPWVDAFVAVVEGDDIAARLVVTTSVGDGLVEFLAGLAEGFHGWTGARSWESMGRELKISAVFRSRGYVALTWCLTRRQYGREGWAAEVTTVIEAGEEMRRLAADMADFVGWDAEHADSAREGSWVTRSRLRFRRSRAEP